MYDIKLAADRCCGLADYGWPIRHQQQQSSGWSRRPAMALNTRCCFTDFSGRHCRKHQRPRRNPTTGILTISGLSIMLLRKRLTPSVSPLFGCARGASGESRGDNPLRFGCVFFRHSNFFRQIRHHLRTHYHCRDPGRLQQRLHRRALPYPRSSPPIEIPTPGRGHVILHEEPNTQSLLQKLPTLTHGLVSRCASCTNPTLPSSMRHRLRKNS